MKLLRLLRPLGLSALVCNLSTLAFAQDAAAPAGTVALAETKTLFDKIMLAGPTFMLILFLSSVFMVWLIIDGLIRTAKP
ncbi:MAG: hypothetical protein ABW223_09470, partial [Rariglobus sp.]